MRKLAPLVLFLVLIGARAQSDLEVLALRHRTAEELIPVLRPLLEPGGVMTGQGYRLIVRASGRNLSAIRSALASLDRPLRRLLISVRHGASAEEIRREQGARARIGGGDSRVSVHVAEARGGARERVEQRVQVLEGGRARIAASQSRPLVERSIVSATGGRVIRETTTLQHASTGFEVVPRLAGDIVHLEIAPQREALGVGGLARGERIATTVSARLGEWVEIGGAATAADERGVLSTREIGSGSSGSVWIKVEEVPN
ncbi:MAG: secretin N-terminal domain-containing protein [Pseudomonadota bacterium]